ncbi:MAG: glycosyltransferase, partial [Alicyclobacillus sp.]|nr:glycosyltransferase [Alicyclobacillus sp.]
PVVVVLDADTRVLPHTLATLAAPLADKCVLAAGGSLFVMGETCSATPGHAGGAATGSGAARWWLVWQVFEYMRVFCFAKLVWSAWNTLLLLSGAMYAIRRDVLLDLGGWRSLPGEDLDLTLRLLLRRGRNLHQRMVLAADAVAWTSVPQTGGALWRQRVRWQCGLLLCLRQHLGPLLRRTAWRVRLVLVAELLLCGTVSPFFTLLTGVFWVPCQCVALPGVAWMALSALALAWLVLSCSLRQAAALGVVWSESTRRGARLLWLVSELLFYRGWLCAAMVWAWLRPSGQRGVWEPERGRGGDMV